MIYGVDLDNPVLGNRTKAEADALANDLRLKAEKETGKSHYVSLHSVMKGKIDGSVITKVTYQVTDYERIPDAEQMKKYQAL